MEEILSENSYLNGSNMNVFAQLEQSMIGHFPREHHVAYCICLIIAIIYVCLALAILSEFYFVPSIVTVSSELNISKDVAGATIMAVSASLPQLAFNFIGDFVSFDDVGIGGTIGSAFCTALFIPSLCGMISSNSFQLDRIGLIRDGIFFIIVSVNLAVLIYSGFVKWWMAALTCSLYFFYAIIIIIQCKFMDVPAQINNGESMSILQDNTDEDKIWEDKICEGRSLICCPENYCLVIPWLLVYPIILLFYISIPDHKSVCCGMRMIFLTILLSVMYIGILSYLLLVMIDLFSTALKIDSMRGGILLLGIGGSLPDMLNSVIAVRHGNAILGISNAMGSLVFDLTIALGVPWLIFDIQFGTSFQLNNILFVCVLLIISCFVILFTFCVSRFILNKLLSLIFFVMYVLNMVLIFSIDFDK